MSKPPTRREFLTNIGLSAAAFTLPGCLSACRNGRRKASRKPNIVYILADDLGYGDPRCNNPDSKIPTPNLDRLAAQGMRFTDAHSGSAVCTPTRYGILTGRYCWRTRLKRATLMGHECSLIKPDRLTVPSFLKQSGYRTACIGKWHLGLDWPTTDGETATSDLSNIDYSQPIQNGPCALGFDHFFGTTSSPDMAPYVYIEDDRVTRAPTGNLEPRGGLRYWRAGPIAPDFVHVEVLPKITKKSVEFIDNPAPRNENKPFFLYIGLSAPHTPVVPAAEFLGKSNAGPYGDFVYQVDWTVGQILAALDRNGLADNTLVILTSDNGSTMEPMKEYSHLPNDHLRGRKSDAWDGGHRVPFLARWPGMISPGTVSRETICLTDLLATCAAILGRTLPADAGQDSYNILLSSQRLGSDGFDFL